MTTSKENRAIGFVANKLIWPVSSIVGERRPKAGLLTFVLESAVNLWTIVQGFKFATRYLADLGPQNMDTAGLISAGLIALTPMVIKAGSVAVYGEIEKRKKVKKQETETQSK